MHKLDAILDYFCFAHLSDVQSISKRGQQDTVLTPLLLPCQNWYWETKHGLCVYHWNTFDVNMLQKSADFLLAHEKQSRYTWLSLFPSISHAQVRTELQRIKMKVSRIILLVRGQGESWLGLSEEEMGRDVFSLGKST